MRVILGTPGSYKTTLLLSTVYRQIEEYSKESQDKSPDSKTIEKYAVFITSKHKLNYNSLVFGTYSEVTIDVLRNIRMKYMDSFRALTEYFSDFHLIDPKPSVVVVDGLEQYCTDSNDRKTSQLTSINKKLKADYIINMINNLELLYKDTSNPIEFICSQRIFSTVNGKDTKESAVSISSGEYNFLASLYLRYTSQIYLTLVSPNTGGKAFTYEEEFEEDDIVHLESRSKNEQAVEFHIGKHIISSTPFEPKIDPEEEFEFVQAKMISLYKIRSDEDAIFRGEEVKNMLYRLDHPDSESNEEAKLKSNPDLKIEEDDEIITNSMIVLRDHVLGDAQMEYEQDGQQIIPQNNSSHSHGDQNYDEESKNDNQQ